jgi:hypothetical protein
VGWLAVAAVLLGCGDDAGDEGGMDTDAATSGNASSTSEDPATSGGSGTSMGATTAPESTGTSTTSEASTSGAETSGAESTGEGDSSTGGGMQDGGSIDVTLSGCDVDFGGDIVVTYNGSLGVASVYDNGGTLSGSFQFDLDGTGSMQLSTQHRVDTENVINMVDVGQGTWTNMDSDALSGGEDSIGGTLTVSAWNPSRGEADLSFAGVSLMNLSNGNVCTIDGTVVAEALYP